MPDLIDIKIENGQIVFDESGDVVFIRGAERVRQQLEFHLNLWAGEWFLDTDFGVPYRTDVLGKLGQNSLTLDAAVGVIRDEIMKVEGVISITALTYSFDRESRHLSISVECATDYGLVTYTQGAAA